MFSIINTCDKPNLTLDKEEADIYTLDASLNSDSIYLYWEILEDTTPDYDKWVICKEVDISKLHICWS